MKTEGKGGNHCPFTPTPITQDTSGGTKKGPDPVEKGCGPYEKGTGNDNK